MKLYLTPTEVDILTDSPTSEARISTPGLSGKKVTATVLVLLALIGGSLAYMLWVYDRLDDLRAQTATIWRQIASQLDQQYRQIGAAAESEQTEGAAEFLANTDQFRTAINLEQQVELAIQIEAQLQKLPASATVDPGLRELVASYNEAVQAELAIMNSTAGRALRVVLPVPERQRLELSR